MFQPSLSYLRRSCGWKMVTQINRSASNWTININLLQQLLLLLHQLCNFILKSFQLLEIKRLINKQLHTLDQLGFVCK